MIETYPKRIRDDAYFGGGILRLSDWSDLDENEKRHAAMFEEGLEATFSQFPPYADVTPTEDGGDIKLTFSLYAGQDDGAPIWQFLMRREIANYAAYEVEDVERLIKALWRVIGYARMVRERMKGLDQRDGMAGDRLRMELLDEFPPDHDPYPPWFKEIAADMMKHVYEQCRQAIDGDEGPSGPGPKAA